MVKSGFRRLTNVLILSAVTASSQSARRRKPFGRRIETSSKRPTSAALRRTSAVEIRSTKSAF
jgi:hypothetical protein